MERSRLIRIVVAAAGLLCGPLLLAQTATLTGTVTDRSGAVVPNAEITATQQERNVTFRVSTDAAGRYTLQNLPIGTFVLEAKAEGFRLYRQTGVILTVDLRALQNITLEVGEISQTIDVEGSASRVDTQTTTIQHLVDSKRIEQLPLDGRNVYSLAKLVPGTGLSGFSIGGGREGGWGTTTSVRLDGGNNVDRTWMRVLSSPSPDAVEEFSIQTSVPSAKYAHSAGVIEVATKSGTNELHGTLYEFFRNDALNGRNFFSATPLKLKRNQYGVAAGGPVWIPKVFDGRNKLFWFFNWEQQKQPSTALTTIYTPTAQQRQGDFSGARTITDPLTKQPFPGNVIPASRIDPIAANVIDQFVPLPQEPSTGLYRFQYPNDSNPQQILGRLDYHIGANQFSYRTFRTSSSSPISRGTLPYFNGASVSESDTSSDTFTFTRIVTPAVVNVFRFTAAQYLSGQRPIHERDHFPLETLRAMGWSQNYYAFGDTLPEMGVSGFFTAGSWRYYWYDHGDDFTFDDEISWIRGRHSMEMGFNYTLVNESKDDEGSALAGQYVFNGAISGLALADFMIGKPSSFQQRLVQDLRLRSHSFAWYFQDNIKVSRRFSLNLGLRYDLPIAPSNALREFMIFRPGSTQRSQRFVNAPPGLFFPGDPGVGDKARTTPKNLFGPRVGLTYALTSDQKTVLRIGYGLMYNPSWLQQEAQFAEKNPFSLRQTLNAPPSTADPWADFPGGNPFPGKVGASDYVFFGSAAASYGPNFTDPNMQQWNINIQREISRDYLVKVAYVGTKGTHLMLRSDINAAIYGPGATLANLNSRRPYAPELAAVDWLTSDGNSTYHSAQVSLDKRFSKGFSVQSAYTFSKSIDYQTGGYDAYPQDIHNWAAERSLSSSDRTHIFRTSWVWSIPTPFGLRGIGRHILGGWDVTGILSLYSGAPLAMTDSVDRALRGLTNRPDRLHDPRITGERSTDEMLLRYFDTTAYARNQPGQSGSAPRVEGQLRAPGVIDFDAGVVKHIRFNERHRLDIRGEFFNLPNHTNFNGPGTNINSSGSFGRITSASSPRIVQLALKYAF